jgi:type I restriction enzyme S subunit
MEGWRTTTIDAACYVEYGTRVVKKRDGGSIYPVYGGGGATFFMDTSNRANRVVVSRFGMSELCTRYVDGEFFLNDSGLTLSPRDTNALLPEFLDRVALALNDEIFALGKGAAQKNLDVPAFRGLRFAYPVSLPEQRRIVAILDEAFEAIATAKANTEKNLQNAQALLDGHLHDLFSQHREGWQVAPVVECFKVRSGDFLPAKAMVADGAIPVYGGNGVAGSHNAANLSGEQVVIGRVGAKCGNVRHVVGDIWLTDNAFHISEYLRPFDPAFLAKLLGLKNLRQTANQAAQPVISYTTIKNVELSFPVSIESQRDIASKLSELEGGVADFVEICEQKFAALDELKKSLLHQAFTGQLTAKTTDQQLEAVA